MFRWVVTIIEALWKVYIPYRSLVEALNTLSSPPVVSFNPSRFFEVARCSDYILNQTSVLTPDLYYPGLN